MITISIKVIPKSSYVRLRFDGDILKAWILSPPEDGKANAELVRILAKKLKVPKSVITIRKGKTIPHKIVDIEGITVENLRAISV